MVTENMNSATYLSSDDFPTLYQAASKESEASQKRYLSLIKYSLGLTIIGSALSYLAPFSAKWATVVSALSGFTLLAATAAAIWLAVNRPERSWYGARAIAESVKTLSWRYMMMADPFSETVNPKGTDNLLCDRLLEILAEREELAWRFGGDTASCYQISERMRHVRDLPLKQKVYIYINERVREQMTWYSKRSGEHKKSLKGFFIIIVSVEILACASAFVGIIFPDYFANATAIFAAGSMAFISWIQVRQFQEQAQAYSIAALELNGIESLAENLEDLSDFQNYVEQAEKAISREHTLWVARRC